MKRSRFEPVLPSIPEDSIPKQSEDEYLLQALQFVEKLLTSTSMETKEAKNQLILFLTKLSEVL
jgi:hypothetical protein